MIESETKQWSCFVCGMKMSNSIEDHLKSDIHHERSLMLREHGKRVHHTVV